MKKRYWLFSFLAPFFLSSCQFYDKVFGDYDPQPTPDTLVLSVEPRSTEVQYLHTDSNYTIVRYWLSAAGERLYKSLEEPYRKGRLHGKRYAWNDQGLLIHESEWDEGLKVGIARDWHDNGQLKQYIQYSDIGNKEYEANFHDNGKESSDLIVYNEGRLHGDIYYYDEKGKHIETRRYSNDTLLAVNIYKDLYKRLEEKGEYLAAKKRREDQMAIVKADSLRKAIAENNKMMDSIAQVKEDSFRTGKFEFLSDKVLRVKDDTSW